MKRILCALLVTCAAANAAPVPDVKSNPNALTAKQKNAAVLTFVRTATDCIASTVAKDDRFAKAHDLGDIIVDSMPSCLEKVHAMIDEYDRHFGDGTGEAFFMGPYLDLLPTVIIKWVRDNH